MKKILIVMVIIWFVNGPLWAQDTSTQEAVAVISKMLNSLDHIRTLQCDVRISKMSPERTVTLNYFFAADENEQILVKMKDPQKGVYVKNRRGYFLVLDHNPIKQPKQKPFPFDIPHNFLKSLKVKDVTDNYYFQIKALSSDQVIVDMLPIGAGGSSIAAAYDNDRVTQLTFTINKPFHTLKRVEIYKNGQTKTNDIIEIDYEFVNNKALQKENVFKNKLSKAQQIAISHSKTKTDLNGIQIKEIWYDNVTINDELNEDLYDEEDY